MRDSVVILLLAYVFFCLGGQRTAFAAEDAVLLETPSAAPMSGEVPGNNQDDLTGKEVTAKPGATVVAGRVHFVAGEVLAVSVAGENHMLQKGDIIGVGDTIISGTNASAQIRMEDGGLIALRPDTQLKFDSFAFSGKEDGTENSFFTLSHGGFRAVTGLIGRTNKNSYRITTPAAIIGINGTDHEVVYLASDEADVLAGTYSKVNSGGTTLTTDAGSVNVAPDQMGYAPGMSQLPQLLPVISSLFPDAQNVTITGSVPASGTELSGALSVEADIQAEVGDEGTIPEAENGESLQSGDASIYDEEAEIDESSESTFVPAPIRWGGDISESFRKQRINNRQSSMQNVQVANVRASTYVWQPWLAQVNGGIGVVNAKNVSGTTANDNVSFVGRGALAVAPYSRFPFSAAVYSTDSRSDTQELASASDYVNTKRGFEVQQRYRPQSRTFNSVASYNMDRTGVSQTSSAVDNARVNSRLHLRHDYHKPGSPSNVGVGYDRRTTEDRVNGYGVINGLQGNFTSKYGKESLAVNAIHTDSKLEKESTSFDNISVRQTYRPDALLSISNSGFVSQSKLLDSAQVPASSKNFNLSSNASWQPDEELPFYVFGSVRVSDLESRSSSTSSFSKTFLGNVNVNYKSTPNLQYSVHETVGHISTSANSISTTQTGGGVVFHSDPSKLGSATYSWNSKGSVDYETNSQIENNLRIAGGAGQGVKFPYALDNGAMNFNINQSLLLRNDNIFGQTSTITHNAGAMWRPVRGERMSGAVNFTVSDIRNFGYTSSHIQTANLSMDTQLKTSTYSNVEANAVLGWRAGERGQNATNYKVDIRYSHFRVLNVRGLRYNLTISTNKTTYDNLHSLGAENSRSGYLIDNRLEYTIGRAYLRFNASAAKNDTSKNSLIILQLGRYFGEI